MIFGANSRSVAVREAASGLERTYADLSADIQRTAGFLKSPRKSLIFTFCRNDYATLRGYLAGLASEHAAALLDEGMPEAFRTTLLSLYEPEFVIHSRSAPTGLADDSYDLIDSAGPCVWRKRQRAAVESLHPDVALLLSTSGSTGTPKFVRLSAENLIANARSIVHGLGITPADRAITSLPFHYSYGLSVVNTHLRAGASLVLTNESITSRPFWDAVRCQSCTSLAGVPYSFGVLNRLKLPGDGFASLRTLTQAGGRLSDDFVLAFHAAMRARNGHFYVMYGQTEATARIAILDPDWLPEKIGSAGRPILDGEIRTDNGEVVYSGPNVMLGYASCRSDLAKGDELNSTLRTGDLGDLDRDGFLFITGRLNRYAKLSGLRFNLDELESMLKDLGPSAVVGVGERLVVFCEGDQPRDFGPNQKELARKLSIHHRLIDFRSICRLPLKNNGKIDYQTLEAAARC